MKKVYVFLTIVLMVVRVAAQSEPSTYFNIFLPPNNEPVQRNVALIVTAVSDSTTFSIIDDDKDGDSDDTVSGRLNAGQSYVLYMKDNGINDDALYASGGTLKRDGDYFTIRSNKLVYASMSTDSDWQHDFVPSVNKKTVGQKFIVYAPKVSSSPRDLNVFAYEENTTVTVHKISSVPTLKTGYTNIDLSAKKLVIQKTISPGQDLIHYFNDGQNIMESGGTYLVESNKNVSVQYGALFGNARDGGSYVPSSNGSGAGDLFYFAVPYQAIGEQEIRVVSWDDNNEVNLSRYSNGRWISVRNWKLNALSPADWVGKQDGNVSYPTVFRVTATPGKRVSVMEANWMETGSNNTSDMATMVSSESGTSSGTRFLAYMLPPGNQKNVVNPFTGKFFNGSFSHFYLFAGNKNTTVTIKDAQTRGKKLSRTYNIEAGRYADAFFSIDEWKSIYNGTGTPSGSERPNVLIESTERISVLSTNFNDNWMSYFGSSLPQSFVQEGQPEVSQANPGNKVKFRSKIKMPYGQTVKNSKIKVGISSGLIPSECKLKKNGNHVADGKITTDASGSVAEFNPIPEIVADDDYEVETSVIVAPTYNNGAPIPNEAVLTVETIVSGEVDGELQESHFSQGIQNNSANTSGLMYSVCQITTISAAANDSWNSSWVDYDGDGWEDLFVTTKSENQPNELYRNMGNGSFTRILNHPLVNEKATTVAAIWGDINNDGRKDVLLVNATKFATKLYLNVGNGMFTQLDKAGLEVHPQYYHGASFADFDNDGYLDLIITNFFETRFHQLYRNKGDLTFELITNTPVTTESERSMAPVLADYNNDGLVDIFIPNGNDRANSLFRNTGNFQFVKVNDKAIAADAKNSVGAAWGDYNNDGNLDLLVVNASDQYNDLYVNKGDGTFERQPDTVLDNLKGDSHGAAWVDMNNDGWLDLYITNDEGASFMYINDTKGGFVRKIDEVLSGSVGNAYGISVADYNKDGFQDLVVSTHTDGNTRFFCNNGSSANWIGFHLQGRYSNAQALGARVAVKSGGIWQHKQNLPVSGFGSQHSQFIHFGIGSNNLVDSVRIVWPSGVVQYVHTYKLNNYNQVLEEPGRMVAGVVFHDLNRNGVKEDEEVYVPNLALGINNEFVLSTDNRGIFQFRTKSSAVAIAAVDAHWNIDSRFISHEFRPTTDTLVVNIPVQEVILGVDLAVSVSTTAWRRGFTNETVLQIKNTGTTTCENAEVELEFPAEAYMIGSLSDYTDKGDKKYSWLTGQLKPGATIAITLTDSVGLEAKTGQFLVLKANVKSEQADINMENNKVDEEIEVVGAIDPNDMLVSPKGEGPQGYINRDTWLTYTIRFENIGTYKATYVFLKNQLPLGLDFSTFEMVSSSHPNTYSLSKEGKLDVSYRNIDLLPVTVDSLLSQGYFKYRIKPRSDVMGGTELANSAEIVFDFEAPIVTNTLLNTIKRSGTNEAKALLVYPSRVTNQVTITIDRDYFSVTEPQVISEWTILDHTGKEMMSGSGEMNPDKQIEVGNLSAGMYLIRAIDQNGQAYAGKMIRL